MFVVILGAGPAGMTCANALRTFGIDSAVVERDSAPGGAQRTNFHPNLWLLGSPDETGRQVTERMVGHFRQLGIPLYLSTTVRRVARSGRRFTSILGNPQGDFEIGADAIVIATGMRPRATLELEALARSSPRVIIGPLSDTIRDGIRKGRVLILGGGDNALDHALYLADRDNRITVHTRRSFSARPGFLDAAKARREIELHANRSHGRIIPDGDGVLVEVGGSMERYDWLLVMYGYRPNTEVLAAFTEELCPELTECGHIRVDAWQRTSCPGVYAAGDITESPQPSVLAAIAQGLAAAKAIERRGLPER